MMNDTTGYIERLAAQGEFRRRMLHETFGGQQQGGISTPSRYPVVMIFTGDSGEQYGYHDGWQEDGTFWYTGEGQRSDMLMQNGNRAIRDHAVDGKDLHLFRKTRKAYVEHVGQMVCEGYFRRDGVPDVDGALRSVLIFILRPIADLIVIEPDLTAEEISMAVVEEEISALSDTELEEILNNPLAAPAALEGRRMIYRRSAAVKVAVLRRAAGICEGCGDEAPFVTVRGEPYLEPHHTRRISDGGPDLPQFVIALCPNCHRRVHYADDGDHFNQSLLSKLATFG